MSVAWGRAEVPGTRSTQRDHDDAAVLGGQQQGFRDRAPVRLVLLGFGQAVPLRYSVASLPLWRDVAIPLFLFGVVFALVRQADRIAPNPAWASAVSRRGIVCDAISTMRNSLVIPIAQKAMKCRNGY